MHFLIKSDHLDSSIFSPTTRWYVTLGSYFSYAVLCALSNQAHAITKARLLNFRVSPTLPKPILSIEYWYWVLVLNQYCRYCQIWYWWYCRYRRYCYWSYCRYRRYWYWECWYWYWGIDMGREFTAPFNLLDFALRLIDCAELQIWGVREYPLQAVV